MVSGLCGPCRRGGVALTVPLVACRRKRAHSTKAERKRVQRAQWRLPACAVRALTSPAAESSTTYGSRSAAVMAPRLPSAKNFTRSHRSMGTPACAALCASACSSLRAPVGASVCACECAPMLPRGVAPAAGARPSAAAVAGTVRNTRTGSSPSSASRQYTSQQPWCGNMAQR